MPSIRNILHKREDLTNNTSSPRAPPPPPIRTIPASPSPPEFTFLRSDTFGEEVISPPTHADDPPFSPTSIRSPTDSLDSPRASTSTSRRSFQLFTRNRASRSESLSSPSPPRPERRLSNLLHRDSRRSRSDSRDSSVNIPQDLPQIADDVGGDKQEREAAWGEEGYCACAASSAIWGTWIAAATNIQEAIRLHESGDLERSTQMFGQLANPNGANNPLSQVLYGLALRHGWGCTKDEAQAVTYLSAAASNSAAIEAEALRAGIKKGGAAKGELVLAIFELANCFRNGWGVAKDPAAARQYYETAANLGDTDAMNEVAWCYLEGFGGKKEKFKAAKYYRLAEESGCPTMGNSWIWKEKYNPK
ncbi:hypothetical protein N7454_005549 [Penicillium verhagenii]|nr:hypothetical protein N7454_005549 [Penicillium verhagenii]